MPIQGIPCRVATTIIINWLKISEIVSLVACKPVLITISDFRETSDPIVSIPQNMEISIGVDPGVSVVCLVVDGGMIKFRDLERNPFFGQDRLIQSARDRYHGKQAQKTY